MIRRAACFAIALSCFCVHVAGQVKAYTDKDKQAQVLESPMVLELPLTTLAATAENEELKTGELSRFVCRGVHVKLLEMKHKADKEGGELVLRGKIILENVGEDDTTTSVAYELVADGKVVAKDKTRSFGTEEGEIRSGFFKLKVALAAAPDLKACTLRLTVAVEPE